VYIPIAQEFPAFGRDLAFIFIARLARKPVAIHLHGGFFGMFYNSQGRLTRWLVRSLVGNVAVGIVLTEQLRPALECVLPANRVVVVQNGLDLPQDHEERMESLRNNQVRALFLSSLFPSKGLFVFIEAIAEARAASPELQGIIAGPWPTEEIRSQAIALVRSLSMEEAVSFVGPVEGVAKARLFREVDIFCFPSSYPLEGQPLVIIEAMAAGLPVVATEWRGIPETVVDGETGILVDIASPKLVAEKLTLLAGDAELRSRLGAAGRARYERLYTQGAFGDRMLHVLRPLLTADAHNYSRAEEVPE
jgi:glycosyltransferase involved in cell wall biosynthesis